MTKLIILPALLAMTLAGEFVVEPMPRPECERILKLFKQGHPYSAGTDSVATWMTCADVHRSQAGEGKHS